MKNKMTGLVLWLEANGYQPPFSRETITKAIVSTVGMSPSTVYGYLNLLKKMAVMRGATARNTYTLNLQMVEKLEGTDLSKIKEKWKK